LKGQLKQADLLLSTRHLDRIIEHEPADLIASAEAGVTLANFNEELSRNGQWLPLDPPEDPGTERITLGGIVATGLAGAQQLGYGPPRRSVIGMRVVLADGTAIKVGGRVVKNVAGYDLCKLFTGSQGTLGVITELTFKLRPLPAACATLIVAGDRDLLLTAARSIRSSSLFLPVAIELLSGLMAANLNLLPGTHEALLLMRFAGSPGAVEDQITRAHEIAVTQSEFINTQAERDADIWRLVAGLPLQHGGEQWRAGVAPAQVQNFLSHLSDRTGWQAGLGTGIIRGYVQPDERAGYFGELRNHAEELDGWLTTDREIEEPAPSQNGPRHSAAEALMNCLKGGLDPNGILPRCRFGSY
jgi:hypothetical protein